MAACPTCFTKVDITAAAVRAAKYASAARDRYECTDGVGGDAGEHVEGLRVGRRLRGA